MNNDDNLRYPIGKFQPQPQYTEQEIAANINRIESLPSKVSAIFKKFDPKKLDTPYRDGGWTARQVFHHLPDSHVNAYIRTKWTLSEDTPVIKAYDENAWAKTPEVALDPQFSIDLLKAIHHRWVSLVRNLTPEDFLRSFIHPDTQKPVSLARQMALYAWHGEHHLGHLEIVLNK